jgi:hypothetical protein
LPEFAEVFALENAFAEVERVEPFCLSVFSLMFHLNILSAAFDTAIKLYNKWDACASHIIINFILIV